MEDMNEVITRCLREAGDDQPIKEAVKRAKAHAGLAYSQVVMAQHMAASKGLTKYSTMAEQAKNLLDQSHKILEELEKTLQH